jgi:hypothetical protein
MLKLDLLDGGSKSMIFLSPLAASFFLSDDFESPNMPPRRFPIPDFSEVLPLLAASAYFYSSVSWFMSSMSASIIWPASADKDSPFMRVRSSSEKTVFA